MTWEHRSADPRDDALCRDPDDLIRLPEVRAMIGLSKTEIYRRASAGTFPKGRRLSHRVAVWRWGDVDRWRRKQMSTTDLIG